MQNQGTKSVKAPLEGAQEGLSTATSLLEEIVNSEENAAAGQVLASVQAVQDAWACQQLGVNLNHVSLISF